VVFLCAHRIEAEQKDRTHLPRLFLSGNKMVLPGDATKKYL